MQRYLAMLCDIDTMDATVDGINTTLTNATFEIGLAADVPKQADDYAPSNAKNKDGRAAGTGGASQPSEQVPEALDPGKGKNPAGASDPTTGKNQQPTNEVPPVLDPGKGKNQEPTNEVPPVRDPGKGKNQEPTNEVPAVLDPGKGKNQEPTTEVPPVLDPGKGQAEPPVSNDPGGQASGKKGKKPRDPNEPSTAEKIGAVLGGIIGTVIQERERRRQGGGSGGGNTGGSGSGGGGSSGGQNVDLSGTWEATVPRAIRTEQNGEVRECPAWLTWSLRYSGPKKWAGPVAIRHNCPPNPRMEEIIKESLSNVSVEVTGPETVRLNAKVPMNGTFRNSQMVFVGPDGKRLTFVRK